MKRTELEKRERNLKKAQKKIDVLERKSGSRARRNVGNYISDLFALFRYDTEEIFNTTDDVEVLELLEYMKEEIPEKQWDNILRKAIKKTGVNQRDRAMLELCELIGLKTEEACA